MRILAVRGENICSLQDLFELDFTREPLAGAGLFAISGPTGSGKSTLLDVICLALYHTTPRLLSAPQRDVSVPDAQAELGVSDARHLLRKGAASGFAEVDFLGTDGQRYRARWAVRRARDSAHGKLQKVQVSLRSLSVERLLSDATTEVAALNVQKIGLTFPEFTRSVLLAQNEFTSFLRATDNEKAAILEKLTGLEIFAKVGRNVYRTCETHERKMRDFQLLMQQCVTLNDAERLEMQKTAAEVQDLIEKHRQVMDTLNLEIREQDALRRVNAQHAEVLKSIDAKEQNARRLMDDVVAAEKALQDLQSNWMLQEPILQEARALDARLQAQKSECERAEEYLRLKETSLAAMVQEQKQQEKDRAERVARLKDIESWTSTHAAVRPWAEHWGVCNTALKRAGEQRARADELQKNLSELNKQKESNEIQYVNVLADRDKVQKEVDGRELKIQSLAAQLDQNSIDDLQHRKSSAELQMAECRKRLELKSAHAADVEKSQHSENEIRVLHEQLVQLTSLLETSQAHVRSLEQEIEVRQRVKATLETQLSKNVTALRAQLVEGSECPVCGALEHPFVTRAVEHPLHVMLKECQSAVNEASESLKTESLKHKELIAEHARTEATLRATQVMLTEVKRRIEEHSSRWKTGKSGRSIGEAAGEFLQEELEAAERQVRQCTEAFKGYSEVSAAVQRERSELSSIHLQFKKTEELCQEFVRNRTRLADRLLHASESLAECSKQMESDIRSVSDVLGDNTWVQGWMKDSVTFVAQYSENVVLWKNTTEESARLQVEWANLGARLDGILDNVRLLDTDVQSARQAVHQSQSARADLHDKRRHLLAGRSVEDVAREYEEKRQHSSQSVRMHTDAHQKTQLELTSLQGRLSELSQQINRLTEESQARRAGILQYSERLGVVLAEEHVQERLRVHAEACSGLEEKYISLRSSLDADLRAREEHAELRRQMTECEAHVLRWRRLSELIGCANGNRFRKEAQRFTLALLLNHANHHLESFAPRYRLLNPADNLNILVEDIDAGGEIRSVYSLSGGESFLVSLALAMGLSSVSSEHVQVESLFIDEGFGSLDSESLRMALNALDALQSHGRKVGVISHVAEMSERIGVQIQVIPQGQGRSRVLAPTFAGV